MEFIYAFGLLLSIAHAATDKISKDLLDGWNPCAMYTFAEEGTASGTAECAIYTAPLCYPGICDTPISRDKTMDIFVKRLPATTGNADTATNIWLVEGGPGAASSSIEFMMVDFHARLNGTVNVYSMDHRVAACAKAVERKYKNLAAFSMTSAATDLKTLISEYSNGADTIVYGVSYGSTLVERLMHLDPPTVTGKLDPRTPHKYAEYLLDALEGDNKELVTFQHVVHGTLSWSFLDEEDYESETCGMKIFLSYVHSGADLAALNKSCLDEMPPLNWTTPIDYRNSFLSVVDPYDGIYDVNLSA
ncbi:Serine protease [Phytophthora megakarya]|uniref:Serine protease n=1 Tax=Phytophthora megakarya TaxID=4795 RepID=A0A225WGS8_9STRA|nr:Serine protease [Phytophthora megakarya]